MALTNMLGASGGEESLVSLSVPCKAEYVSLCRLAVGALGSQEGLGEETIADLKLAVTEACACFIGQLEAGGVEPLESSSQVCLRVDFGLSPRAWTVSVSNPDRHCRMRLGCFSDSASEGALRLTIIQALVDSLEQSDSEENGSLVRFVKRLPV